MKYIITESQHKLISELERHWIDFEYEEQYNRLKNKLVSFVVSMIDSYETRFGEIVLFDSSDNIVMVFKPHSENNRNGSLYYDRSFVDSIEGMFAHPIWLRHGKYVMADAFNHLYPEYIVRSSQSANIS
jgi:hypothetical protein